MIEATARTNGTVDLVGKQGTTWTLTIQLFEDDANTVPMDLTSFLVRGQYRKDYKDASPVLIAFGCTIDAYDITENPDTNKITVVVLPQVSTDCTVLSGVYDIEIYNGTDIVERILAGKLAITPEVTREVV
jgi:hypothetical protein